MADRRVVARLSLVSDPGRFAEARRWVQEIVREADGDDRAGQDLMVALSEALANAHRHGYAGTPSGPIDLEAETAGGFVRVSVRDHGAGFDPAAWRPPELGKPLEGGYGLVLIQQLMDRVEFPDVDRGTEIVMWKRLRPSAVA